MKRNHSIVARRPCACGCGTIIVVTTNHREKRYLNHEHANRGRGVWSREARAKVVPKHLEKRYGRVLDELLGEDVRITRQQLLRLATRVYRQGYAAGFTRARKDRSRGIDRELPPNVVAA